MAEEEAEAGGEQPAAQGGEQQQQVSGGSKLVPVIIIVVVLLLVAGGLGFYFFVFSNDQPSMEATSPEEAKFLDLYLKRSQPSVEAIKKEGAPIFTPVFSYTVNMKDQRHMMQISFRAKLYDEMALAHLLKYRPVIDNNIMDLLGQVKATDLRNRSGLELLKQALFKELNSHFDQDFIEMSESKDRSPVKDILIAEYYIN